MDQWLLPLVFGLAGIIVVWITLRLWQQRRTVTPPPRPPERALIDMETRTHEGATIADIPRSEQSAAGPRRRWFARRSGGAPRSAAPPSDETDPPPPARRPPTAPELRRPLWQKVAAGLILAVVLSSALWSLPNIILRRPPEQFTVVVVPFADSSGGQTGRVVAESLAETLQEQASGQMVVERVATAPANAQQAHELAISRQADVVIWGDVEAGAMPNTPTLRPRLIYAPQGAYAPNAWPGYLGRFLLPRSYTIAAEPINGEAVLPDLVLALSDLSAGYADRAYEEMGRLLETYPLNAALPRAVRGNVLWARGDYEAAAGEYRRALAQPSDEQALLANNLAAILLDAGSDQALGAMGEAAQMLAGNDLGELRFNLGLLAQREGRTQEAVSELEQARNLLMPNSPLLLALADAYRENGQLQNTVQTLNAAERQIDGDVANTPATLRPLLQRHLGAGLQEQRGLLELAQVVQARGPLTWELEIAPVQPPRTFNGAINRLRSATRTSEELMSAWRSRSAADAAAQNGAGLVALGQAQKAERNLNRQRYHLALGLIETGRADLNRAPGLFAGFVDALFGTGTPLSEGQSLLRTGLVFEPNNTAFLIADARLSRMRGDGERARQHYAQVINRAPAQPEGYYGSGLLAANADNRAEARQLMVQALERSATFFPARIALAELAEQDGDWPVALDQLRTLVQQRPGVDTELALAEALRRSGPAGFAEASMILTGPGHTRHAPSLIELGRLYRAANQLDQAARVYTEARRADPNSATAAFELGEVLAAQGDYSAAGRQFQFAINNDARHTGAYLALADLYRGPLAQPAAADEQYRRALDTGVTDVDQLMRIGVGLLERGYPEPASRAFLRAAEQQGDNPLILHRLAQAQRALNNLDGAAAAEQRVLELTANAADDVTRQLRAAALVGMGDIERLRQRGIEARRQNFNPAIERYNQALILDPNHVEAAVGLGLVAVAQDNWAVALGHFERANTFPGGADNATAQFWLAEALLRQPNLQRAAQAYVSTLQLRSDFPEAWLGLAQVQRDLNDSAAAAASLDEALRLRPRYAEALLLRGKLLEEQGRIREARTAYNDSIAANNRIAETYYRRGMIYLQELDYNRASDDLRRATELQPNFAEAHYWLGRAYFAQEQLNPALTSFQQAIAARGGNYPEARLYQGLVEEAQKRFEAAAASFQAVIQSDELSQWASRARLELEQIRHAVESRP